MDFMKRAVTVIDLDAAAHNLKEIRRKIAPSTKIMAIIKADAYGHGAVAYAHTMLEAGADRLGVATCAEGVELRKNGIKAPILLLGFTARDNVEAVLDFDLTPAVYSLEMARLFEQKAALKGKTILIHIKIETGMNRIGFAPDDRSLDEIAEISKFPHIKIEGLFTHMSDADVSDKTYTHRQKDIFTAFAAKLEAKGIAIPIKHVSNSASIIDLDELNFDLVRPGIMLYGIWPSGDVDKTRMTLKPVMTFKTCISHIKILEQGEYISYNRTYLTGKQTVVGTIPIGYADGYARTLSNQGRVLVNGKFAPIIGRVCMDQILIDLTDIEAKIEDEVVLFGMQNGVHLPADELAALRGTNPYEVVCNISRRVPRAYYKDGKLVHIVDYLVTDQT